jgi:Cys-rich repeat protein
MRIFEICAAAAFFVTGCKPEGECARNSDCPTGVCSLGQCAVAVADATIDSSTSDEASVDAPTDAPTDIIDTGGDALDGAFDATDAIDAFDGDAGDDASTD